jgi:glycosyltransferase involved in cell wall biosynthesis
LTRLADKLRVTECCRFLGAIALDEVLRMMASSTVCIAPSLSEAFGLVNLEAHSVGTPVIASNIGGIPDIVVDGETGYLVQPGDSTQLADKIELILANRDLQRRLSEGARRRFAQTFSLDNINLQVDYFERMVL